MKNKKDHQAVSQDNVEANRIVEAERQQDGCKEEIAVENEQLAPDEMVSLLMSNLRRFNDIKIKEIEKVFDELLSFCLSDNLKGITDFEKVTFSPYFDQELNTHQGGVPTISYISATIYEQNYEKIGRDAYFKEINQFISINYIPPNDFPDIMNHLQLFWELYYSLTERLTQHEGFPSDLFLLFPLLDLSLCKLVGVANKMLGSMKYKWERESLRLKQSIKKIKTKTDLPKTVIYEIYYRNPGGLVKSGMKLNKVVHIIQSVCRTRLIDPPSPDTIKRYLMGDEKIMKDFKKEGRFWIMQ
jgi:hypothetical protein